MAFLWLLGFWLWLQLLGFVSSLGASGLFRFGSSELRVEMGIEVRSSYLRGWVCLLGRLGDRCCDRSMY